MTVKIATKKKEKAEKSVVLPTITDTDRDIECKHSGPDGLVVVEPAEKPAGKKEKAKKPAVVSTATIDCKHRVPDSPISAVLAEKPAGKKENGVKKPPVLPPVSIDKDTIPANEASDRRCTIEPSPASVSIDSNISGRDKKTGQFAKGNQARRKVKTLSDALSRTVSVRKLAKALRDRALEDQDKQLLMYLADRIDGKPKSGQDKTEPTISGLPDNSKQLLEQYKELRSQADKGV